MNNTQPVKVSKTSRRFAMWIVLGGIVMFIVCVQMGFLDGLKSPKQAELPQVKQSLGESNTPQNNSMVTFTPFPFSTPLPKLTPSPTPSYRFITWAELASFLSDDHTNWNEYTDEYVCVNFALDLVANARKQNINAWIVGVTFLYGVPGHAFVAFETTDKGIVYIEAQEDIRYMVLEVGKPLCPAWGNYECMGTVATIKQPLECDAVTHMCYEK